MTDYEHMLNLEDALNIDTADPSEYAVVVDTPVHGGYARKPLPDGRYVGKLISVEPDLDKATGKQREPLTPVFLVGVEITEGEFAGKRLRFQRVRSKPFNRRGQPASVLMDVLYSVNRYDVPTIGQAKIDRLEEYGRQQATVKFRTLTRAFDKRYFEDHGGQHMMKGTPEINALYKAATVRGFSRFTLTDDGRLVTKGPSGDEIEGRAEIDSWLPSDSVIE